MLSWVKAGEVKGAQVYQCWGMLCTNNEKGTLFPQPVHVQLMSMFLFRAAERLIVYHTPGVSHSNIADSTSALVFYPNRVQNPLHLQLWLSRVCWFLRGCNKWNIGYNCSSSNRCCRFIGFHKNSLNISFLAGNESIPEVLISQGHFESLRLSWSFPLRVCLWTNMATL